MTKPEANPKRRAKAPRKSSGPTMLAVAEAAKVSIFTVSAVLNGTSVVSDERRERVEEAIRVTGYKRNAVARSLKTGRTHRRPGTTRGSAPRSSGRGCRSCWSTALSMGSSATRSSSTTAPP